MNAPSWRDWLFSAKTFVAAILALYIAFAIPLPRPYWAMATVYIVSNPFVGATAAKALYRAFGTVLGASAAVFFVPLFVDTPLVLSAVVALWTGTCLYASMFDRTGRSYALMLSGYTLPLIVFASVGNPEGVFDLAVSRSEEILLGILCASVVGATVFPSKLAPTLSERTGAWFADARLYIHRALTLEPVDGEFDALRQRLVATVNGLEALIAQLRYDGVRADVVACASELRGRMANLLPVASALSDPLVALRTIDGERFEILAPLLRRVGTWIDMDLGSPQAREEEWRALRAAIEAVEPAAEDLAVGPGRVLSSALWRLRELIDLWQDCGALQAAIAHDDPAAWKPAYRHWRLGSSTRFFDRPLMLFSASSVVLATFVAAYIWIVLGWEDGGGGVVLAAVACSFFAALDDPAPQIFTFFVWTVVALVLAALYLFIILPNIHDFEMLVLALALPFLCAGSFSVQPRYALMALLTAANLPSFINIQTAYDANFQTFVNSNISGPIGLLFALVWTLVTRPFGAGFAARRMTRSSWSDIVATLTVSRMPERRSMAGRVLDRFMQQLPRLAVSGGPGAMDDGVKDLRVALNALDLNAYYPRLSTEVRTSIEHVFGAAREHFMRCIRSGKRLDIEPPAIAEIDQAIHLVAGHAGSAYTREVLHALVGLRLSLRPAGVPADAPDALPPGG